MLQTFTTSIHSLRVGWLFLALLFSATTAHAAAWQISKVDYFAVPTTTKGVAEHKAALLFSNGKRIELPLHNVKVIGLLRGADDSQFVLAQGTDCTECDEAVTVRLLQLNGEGLVPNDHRYSNAGQEFDFYEPENKTAENHVYYGQCSSASDDVVVWFSEFIGTDDKWHQFHTMATLTQSGATLAELDRTKLTRDSVLQKVAAGVCRKIQASTWLTEP